MRIHSGLVASLSLAFTLLFAPAVFSAPAADFGPEVKVASPQGGFVGRMQVDPLHGEVGAPFTVSAEGLPPNEEFQLVWSTE